MDEDYIIYENNRTRDCPLFCRNSQWTSKLEKKGDVKGRDFEDEVPDHYISGESPQYVTKFQIGFAMNPKDTQMFELQGYLVTYNSQKIFRNTDLIDIFDKKLEETVSNVKIEPYRL